MVESKRWTECCLFQGKWKQAYTSRKLIEIPRYFSYSCLLLCNCLRWALESKTLLEIDIPAFVLLYLSNAHIIWPLDGSRVTARDELSMPFFSGFATWTEVAQWQPHFISSALPALSLVIFCSLCFIFNLDAHLFAPYLIPENTFRGGERMMH
jgi:hypothetical protein